MWSHLAVALSVVYIANAADYSSYSYDNALNALYYAYGAYCDADQLSAWDCKWCEDVNFEVASDGVITGNSLQAFMGYDTDYNQIVLSYRGTANFDDWIKDFDYEQTTYPYSSVSQSTSSIHSGFYDSYKELGSDGVTSALINLFNSYPGSNILVTGHSLGAAIAQIAAMDLRLNYDDYGDISIGQVNVITFGSPRWATQDLVNVYDSTVDNNWRVTNENDIVPTVPYTYMSNGFHHSATEIHYTDYEANNGIGTYEQCDGSGEDSSCEYIGYSIPDHLHYLDLYEDCSSSGTWIDIDDLALLSMTTTKVNNNNNDMMTSVMNPATTIETTDFEDKIIYKWKQGLDNVSKIALSIAVAVGWLCAFIWCILCCRTHSKLKKAQGSGSYVSFHEV